MIKTNFFGLRSHLCLPTHQSFNPLIIQNKTSSVPDSEFTRFDCTYMQKLYNAHLHITVGLCSAVGNMSDCSSDFIWPFLRPYMGVIPNPKMAFIFPISCILALIFPILINYFPKCVGKGSFPKSQIKSLCRYVSDCTSRGLEFNPSLVPYFRGD